MKYIVVDIEADGPNPSDYSMLSLGACTLDGETFYKELKPLRGKFGKPETVAFLKSVGLDRDVLKEKGEDPFEVMLEFNRWLTNVAKGDRLRFVADNAAFDSMFVFWYFHHFLNSNPFGFSALSLTSLYAGFAKDVRKSSDYKKWRGEAHTHNALDDARGNAKAMKVLIEKGMKF